MCRLPGECVIGVDDHRHTSPPGCDPAEHACLRQVCVHDVIALGPEKADKTLQGTQVAQGTDRPLEIRQNMKGVGTPSASLLPVPVTFCGLEAAGRQVDLEAVAREPLDRKESVVESPTHSQVSDDMEHLGAFHNIRQISSRASRIVSSNGPSVLRSTNCRDPDRFQDRACRWRMSR